MKNHFTEAFDLMLSMYRNPGFRDHAVQRIKELDADKTGLYSGMADALRNEIKLTSVKECAMIDATKGE